MIASRLFTALAAAYFLVATAASLHAADATPGPATTGAPNTDVANLVQLGPEAFLAQIRLNVTVKQYEKILTALYDTQLEFQLGPNESGLTSEQTKQWAEMHRI